jgi:hypothetical protein
MTLPAYISVFISSKNIKELVRFNIKEKLVEA